MGRAKPPITNDVRRLFLAAYDRKAGTLRDLAGIFQFSEAFGNKLLRQRRANGHADRIEQRRRTPRRLPLKHRVVLEHWIKEDPQQTLTELKDRLLKERGVEISVPQISRVRKALGVRIKPRPGVVIAGRPSFCRESGFPMTSSSILISRCNSCVFNLRNAPSSAIPIWYRDAHLIHQSLLKSLELNHSRHPEFGFAFHECMYQISRVFVSEQTPLSLKKMIQSALNDSRSPFLRTGHIPLERRSLAERHYLVSVALWVLSEPTLFEIFGRQIDVGGPDWIIAREAAVSEANCPLSETA